MNRLGLIAALAVLSVAPALAQPLDPAPAVPTPMPDSRLEPAGELRESVPPRLIMNSKRAQSDADARHCLDLSTNRLVHRCAERYRARAARAAAAKAAATDTMKAPATSKSAQPADTMKPMEMSKPAAAGKPGEAAKAPAAAPPADMAKGAASPPAAPGKAADTSTTKPIAPAKPADPAKGAK